MRLEGDAAELARFVRMIQEDDALALALLEKWQGNPKQVLADNPPPARGDAKSAKQGMTIKADTVYVDNRDQSATAIADKGSTAAVGDGNVQSAEYSKEVVTSADVVAALDALRETIASMGLDEETCEFADRMLDDATSEASAETPKRSMVSRYVGGALSAVKSVNDGVKFWENRETLMAAIAGITSWFGPHAESILSLFR